MSEDRYNIVFSGELVTGADAVTTRERLGSTFRLNASQLDNLFSGQAVVVKRDVDLMTATRFQQAFLAAGARAAIELVTTAPPAQADPAAPGEPADFPKTAAEAEPAAEDPETPKRLAASPGATLALAPPGTPLDELDDRGPTHQPDTSALSLVQSQDWDLSDCAPPPAATPDYDLSGLALAPLDARRGEDAE
ncbi:hypothetical protein CKO31_11485 [Thiohalocapsa halophila]|uniref:Uncharacterized protein n=1 Tax=Thiohalocapsa halophila TaxID=69359 RepID=A0ABS1CHF9_9GAMM|nr:hypothetical protein [Thiohalocapsa halophila]MBK1631350.1 hypothetical protein [Thiohalocapsa halophila]